MMKPSHISLFFFFFFFFFLSLSSAKKHTWQEAFEALGIAWNKDGTLNRTIMIPMVDPTSTSDPKATVTSQDVSISSDTKAYVRIFTPNTNNKKLPLIVYFHGGDFVLFSATTVIFHDFCSDIASQFPAVVVSVEYRLAPEHRLPAAYDDSLAALLWLRSQSIPSADFSRVFLLGSSAGANIAYHVALRALDYDLRPLQIKGLLLNQAYFGGAAPTASEIRLIEDPYVPLYVNYVLWSLALPEKASRDHEFCNPLSARTYSGRVFRLPKVYIKGDYGDPLVDRSVQLGRFLKSCGVPVYARFNQGGFHGIELQNKTAAQELYDDMKVFVNDSDGLEGVTSIPQVASH